MTDLNMDVEARLQKLEAENVAMREETMAAKASLSAARRRARLSVGMGFALVAGTLLISPGSRRALAQDGMNLYNAYKRIAAVEAVNKTQDTQIGDLYARLKNIQLTPGPQGPKGDKGDKGEKGATGLAGAKGDKGDKGERGATGLTGAKGDKGDKGEQGLVGAKGDKGATGLAGAKGDKGDKGEKGATGLAGAKGDKGEKGATGLTGAKGDQGEQGLPGKDGKDADMSRVEVLENNFAAYASNVQNLFLITSIQGDKIHALEINSVPKAQILDLQSQVNFLTQKVQQYSLVAELFHVDQDNNTLVIGGQYLQKVLVEGANLQVVNGLGSNDTTNGLGNIIVGYNPADFVVTRSGSHNLVLGDNNSYSSTCGFVAGSMNYIAAPYAFIATGAANKVIQNWGAVSGGSHNTVNQYYGVIGGGSELTLDDQSGWTWMAGPDTHN